MDPNEALTRCREAVQFFASDYMSVDAWDMIEQFTDHFEALDKWLTGGGFLPADWNRGTEIGS